MREFTVELTIIGVVIAVVLGVCAYLIYIERKLAAFVQDRLGPNRVGPAGLLQPIADGLKFLLKEEVIPGGVDVFLYLLAPAIAVGTSLLALAVIPFGPTSSDPEQFQAVIAPGIDVGILFIFAVGSLGVYAVILGGWASNNKYSFLGALRASAQMISYEIPLGLSVIGVVMLAGSLNLETIINRQAEAGFFGWYLWSQPLAALLFLVAAMAESNRLPFDLSECEQELVGGFHTEYSALKFAMFFLGEYTHVVVISYLVSILFLGGWHLPVLAEPGSVGLAAAAIKIVVLGAKALAVIVLIMLLRWTLPRFRFDQLMGTAWKVLIPLGLANLFLVMIVLEFSWGRIWLAPISIGLLLAAALIGSRRKSVPPVRTLPEIHRPLTALKMER